MPEAREQRRLAAILAADVVGYSRLMESDESGTLTRLRALRRDIIDPSIAAHSGRMVKLMGDGALVEFASAIDAVTCAVEIQKSVREHNAAEAGDGAIWFRIGINVGDIIVDGDDIYGDGVNIAARLEGLAEPGGIFISRTAADQVRDKVPIRIEDRGDFTVKNIARPIQVFCVVADGLQIAAASSQAAPPAPPKKLSIAVLPFANMSGDAEQEYFADGISEDTITALSKLSQLFVIARNSSFTFKGKNVNVQEVGKSLGVRYVLEGSVRKSGNKVRITAQLIDATTGGHLWAERFDRDLTDIFAVQDDVTQQIVGALALNLTEGDQQRLATEHSENLEAYDCFLRGREQWRGLSKEANIKARDLFQRAIELDPKFAPAYAFLAVAHALSYINRWSPSPPKSLEQAEEAALQAVALDDRYPYAHWALGIVSLYMRRHDVAIREAERSISLAPNLADGHETLGQCAALFRQVRGGTRLFQPGNGLEPVLSGHIPPLPGASDVPARQVRRGNRHPEAATCSQPWHRRLTCAAGGELWPFGPVRRGARAVAGGVPRQPRLFPGAPSQSAALQEPCRLRAGCGWASQGGPRRIAGTDR